eukprot:1325245-Amorphochlora_amoeboformis.AAC.1
MCAVRKCTHSYSPQTILAKNRYICGKKLTMSDIRLFVTIIRFDEVNHTPWRNSNPTQTNQPNATQPESNLNPHATHSLISSQVYAVYFKTNGKLIREYPNILGWTRELYQVILCL